MTATEDRCGIEILRPSLERVFLTLTGRRYESDIADTAKDGASK
ncbi:MAG: hypothetical protein R2706_11415 [Acidimicrobiales bacterium]